ncbi:penicillin-binding transpeptidase domain-containing protein [Streptomyces sp. NPDC050842]|uniref:penicillin-binding transpeptidase domain-containing protein n=1 Tax=Streptomyces sp. NPDC050842 TaxID=3365636 RepID=UPI0037B20AA6
MTTHRAGVGRARRRRWPAVAVTGALVAGAAGWAVAYGPLKKGEEPPRTADPEAVRTAQAFLRSWAAGDLPAAARLTDSPAKAEETLRNFTAGLEITKPALTAGAARVDGEAGAGARVPYRARMPVAELGTWSYGSELAVARTEAGWRVRWELPLIHPQLNDKQRFKLVEEESAELAAVDRDGKAISAAEHPSLVSVLGLGGGKPRGEVRVVDRITGETRSTAVRFGPDPGEGGGPLRTTIDARIQRAAERALARHADGRNAGLVAVRIDSGEVVAVANGPAGGFNRAFQGTYAPGSTWKVVTTAALLAKGAVTPESRVDCPKYLTVGKQFHNVETSEIPGATFREDFIHSCNTAFVALRGRLTNDEMTVFAKDYFGIGPEWKTGVGSVDAEVPVPASETEKAAALFGQGRLRTNPLAMASATATAVSGTFHQPLLVKGTEQPAVATKPLPSGVVKQVRSLMRDTVTDGSAKVLAGLPGEVGAKTGTAEVTEDGNNNGWLVAYDDEIAVACVVEGAESGSGSAGPVLRDLLAESGGGGAAG